jgi:hypothetical protein
MNAFINKLLCFRAFSSFEYGSQTSVVKHDYRVTGFYWVYTPVDSSERVIVHVPKRLATHVGGYGVCGVIVPFAEIKLTGFKIAKRWHFRTVDKVHINWLIKQDKRKYRMYKSIPVGLTSQELSDLTLEMVMNMALKSLK